MNIDISDNDESQIIFKDKLMLIINEDTFEIKNFVVPKYNTSKFSPPMKGKSSKIGEPFLKNNYFGLNFYGKIKQKI
jgi:hypothetical protein